jgi:cystathionine gamma-synthase
MIASPQVVDDSVAGHCNVDLLCSNSTGGSQCEVVGADIVVTSLTKQFSGSGNVMGGSLVLNSRSKHFERLRARLARDHEEDMLWDEDAAVLLRASADLEHRVAMANDSALSVVQQLSASPLVEQVRHAVV